MRIAGVVIAAVLGAAGCGGAKKPAVSGDDGGAPGDDAAVDAASAPEVTDGRLASAGADAAADTGIPIVPPLQAFDGQRWMHPCGPDDMFSNLVCDVWGSPVACHPLATAAGASLEQYLTAGELVRNDTLVVAGEPGTIYDVTARVRGIVEPRRVQGGTRGAILDGVPAWNPSFWIGGAPDQRSRASTYLLWVSEPVVSETTPIAGGDPLPGQYYWLNAISQREEMFAYMLDYTVTFPVAAGATVRFLLNDVSCSYVKNCDPTSSAAFSVPGCVPNVLPDFAAFPVSDGVEQPYRGQFLVMHVISVSAR